MHVKKSKTTLTFWCSLWRRIIIKTNTATNLIKWVLLLKFIILCYLLVLFKRHEKPLLCTLVYVVHVFYTV